MRDVARREPRLPITRSFFQEEGGQDNLVKLKYGRKLAASQRDKGAAQRRQQRRFSPRLRASVLKQYSIQGGLAAI